MNNLVEWGRDVGAGAAAGSGIVYLIDPHVLTAVVCTVAAACVAGALVIWLAIEAEMRSKK